jgi:hypothetical protein
MDTAFLNRVGITRGWQYEEINFYPTPSRYGWVKRIAPFVWIAAARDRIQGGTEAYYLPGIRMNFTRAGSVRLDYGRGHETFAGQRFETGQASINGSIQATRWLNVGGSASTGPAIFYDPADPFQGDRTSATLRVGLQPNTRVNSSSSYSFVTFTSRRTGLKVFDVHIVNLRQTYHFTPHFFVRSVEQFDSSQTRVLCDFLASYELSPGTVFYAGYGSLLERAETRSYRASAQALFLKASYLVRF